MKIGAIVVVLLMMGICDVQGAKRWKMCNTANAHSPGKQIIMLDCKDGILYTCGNGDASHKGQWQTCTAGATIEDDDTLDALEYLAGENCWAHKNTGVLIAADGGTKGDGLCIEDIDWEDVLSTFCDDIAYYDKMFQSSAGNCETFGWGLLNEYGRLWLDYGTGECLAVMGKKGGNGQEFCVFDQKHCG